MALFLWCKMFCFVFFLGLISVDIPLPSSENIHLYAQVLVSSHIPQVGGILYELLRSHFMYSWQKQFPYLESPCF